MSGKSTYIRAVALLQVMAQIGCFVPAQTACFRVIRNLLTRVPADDSIEANMSTFSVEMREMAFIIRRVGDMQCASDTSLTLWKEHRPQKPRNY